MKKLLVSCLMFTLTLSLAGCGKEPIKAETIDVKEMREIAELAAVDCYFHNVAKSDKNLTKGWYEFWKDDKMRFWVEYDGIVKIGIDVSQLSVNVDGNVVTITMPPAVVLSASVNEDTLSPDSFYYDPNAKHPNAQEQTEAFDNAQEEMVAVADANESLKESARDNAKTLLENYVKRVGDLLGIEYKIEWVYLD